MTPGSYTRRLYIGAQKPVRALLIRTAIILAIMGVAWLMLWIIRDGLADNRGTHPNALDVLYFSVVTVTTLGYGDIVPVSPEARAIVTFGITPLRLIVWVLLVSTAYELVLRRSIERIEMERLKKTLHNHIVICGFGVKGRSAVRELIERGTPPEQIMVIDESPAAIEEANRLAVNFLLGNAASEQMLRDAAIERAAHAIVVPNNDQACVLICLTIKELAPNVKIRAAAREDENIKLIRRSGADTVVAPSVSAGRLLASATSSPHSTNLIEELFEHGQGADLYDLRVDEKYAGLSPQELTDQHGILVLEVRPKTGETLEFHASRSRPLALGDKIIVYNPSQTNTR
ncbi:MAG: NAD-binding protein [Fimbriimonadaceae bacterium]|nr:NAD-binding protein [Fimbriimonadaceae bacterium]